MTPPTWLESIADWLTEAHDLPDAALHAAERATLDSLACAYGALDHPSAIAAHRLVRRMPGPSDASLIGQAERTSALQAIFYNGTLIRALDCNDVYFARGVGGHPSDNIAVALAFAEWQHATGREYLRAVVLGYELYWRLSRHLFAAAPGYEWDHVSVSGLVAAAMARLLLGMDRAELTQALAIGGAQSYALSEIRAGELSILKATASAIAAQQGALGAFLAAEGMTGPPQLLEGRRGLLAALGLAPDESVRAALAGPATRWHILDATTKPYPAIGTSQGVIAAALALVQAWPVPVSDIERVDVRLPDLPITHEHLSDPARATPHTRETADHSIPFLVAVALEDHEVGPAQFRDERWNRQATQALMARVYLRADSALNEDADDGYPAGVTLWTSSGENRTHEQRQVPGSARRPLSDEALAEKLFRLGCAHLDEPRRIELCRRLLCLRAEPDVGSLATLLRSP